jgi:hypothetical protein
VAVATANDIKGPAAYALDAEVRWENDSKSAITSPGIPRPGRIIKVHSKDVYYKGHTLHASEDEHQYETKSDKTNHIATHKGSALKKLRAK